MRGSRLCLILCFTACVILPAQERRRTHPDDANGDGRISRSEWRGGAAEFQQRDINGDGFLSGTEIPSGQSNSIDERSGRSQGNAEMRKLDKNANGAVEGYEWPYNSDVFHRLDTDGNSVLTADELRNLPSVAQRELDQNPNERPNSRRTTYPEFDRLDTNRDGRVTPEEYSQRGAEWQRRQRFDEWDTNRNGVIDSSEWNAAPQLFRRLDANRDSRVTWEEFRADTERYRPPYNWR
jgi:Ca2+-binding EF-hand superfamily protein